MREVRTFARSLSFPWGWGGDRQFISSSVWGWTWSTWTSLVAGKSRSLTYQNLSGPYPHLAEGMLSTASPRPFIALAPFLAGPISRPFFFFWWAPGVAVCLNTCLVTTEWPGLNKNQDCSRLSPRRQCNLSNSKMPIGVKDLGKAEDWVSNKRLRCQMSLWSKLLRSINCKTRPAPSCTLSRTVQAPLHHSIKEEAVASHSEKGRHNVTQLEEGMCRFRAKLIAPWSQIMTPKTKYSWLCPERPT